MTYQIQSSEISRDDSSVLLVCLRDPDTELEYDVSVDFDVSTASVTAWYSEGVRQDGPVCEKAKLSAEMWAGTLLDVYLSYRGSEAA